MAHRAARLGWVALAPVVITLLMAFPAAALFKEQAGKYDWLKQNVGEVTIARFDSDLVYVASREGAIAALRAVDGALAWRVLLDEGTEVTALEVVGGVVLALTAPSHLRAFSPGGALLWEASLAEEAGAQGCTGRAGMAPSPDGTSVVVACGGFVAAYGAGSGRRSWRAETGAPSSGVSSVHCASGGMATVATAPAKGSAGTLHLATVNAADGSVQGQTTVSGGAAAVALDGGAVVLNANGKVCGVSVAKGSLACKSLADVLPSGAASAGADARLSPAAAGGAAVLQVGGAAAVLALGPGGELTALHAAPGVAAAATAASAVFAEQSAAGLQVTTVGLPGGAPSRSIVDASLARATVDGEPLGAATAFVGAAGQALVQLEELTLAFFPPGAAVSDAAWVRHEALAGATDVLFADLPPPTSENEAAWAAAQPSAGEALRTQLLALKVQVGMASPEEAAAVERHRALTSDRLRPTRDPDGFRRQLVVATAAGKVLSLHTGDGRVLWSLDFGPDAAATRLAPWRTPHDLTSDALAVALRAAGPDFFATVINTHTGAVEREHTVKGAAEAGAELLPLGPLVHAGKADQHVYALVADGKPVEVLPPSDAADAAFAEAAPRLVRWRVSADGSAVIGTGFTPYGDEVPLWTVAAAPAGSGLVVLALAARDPAEAIYSAARPIPGGGILLKHLAPTLLVVAGPPAGSAPSTKASRLLASVIDAVSGRVLFSQTHAAATGPVAAVASENWFAYHFWSLDTERWQVAVLDGYHPAPRDLSVADLALGRPAAGAATAAAAAASPPAFERQTFATRLAAATLGVTHTAHGTTAKMLLIGTPGGQVYMLDRRMIDPRRPLVPPGSKPTPAQAAEALPPFAPELPVAGPLYATLDRRVARLRKIAAAPAVLESASLMAATGLDTFYSRLQPSRGFDMVPDDFPHALLVAMVAGMGVALVLLRAVLQKRALKLKWQ